MRLTREIVLQEYQKAKARAIESFNEGLHEKALRYFEFASSIAVSFPVITDYCDDETEFYLSEIGNIILEKIKVKPKPDSHLKEIRIVFYNGQIVDSGGLTEQYLAIFEELEVKILFIIPDIENTRQGNNILKRLKGNNNVELIIPQKKDRLQKIEIIINAVNNFSPTVAFLHFLPEDVVGFVSFSVFNKTKRFFIDHNDHTFWIGKKCFDFLIEFRDFGVTLAKNVRKINEEKILKIPYYPIINKVSFQGFPFDHNNRIIGVSGGNLNKYYGDTNFTYFHAIKELLNKYPDFVFCLCGWGNEKPVHKFIEANKLKDRFYFLGKRSDFYELVGNCDILFESYPQKGALTVLMAAEQKIPAIGISCSYNSSRAIESMLGIENYKQPANIEEFLIEAEKLIVNKEYRAELGKMVSANSFKKDYFVKSVKNLLYEQEYCSFSPKEYKSYVLNDELNLQEFTNKPHATFSYLLYTKWYYLGKHLSWNEKFKVIIKIISFINSNSIRYLAKILFKRTT